MTTEAIAEHSHAKPARIYIFNILFLLVMLFITVGAAHVDMGGTLGVIVMLTIAFIKTMAIILFFMHVYWSSRLTMAFVIAGFFWLSILFCFTLCDYVTRPPNTALKPSAVHTVIVDPGASGHK